MASEADGGGKGQNDAETTDLGTLGGPWKNRANSGHFRRQQHGSPRKCHPRGEAKVG